MAAINGTSGNDTLDGTAAADVFGVEQGGEDTVDGLGGNDSIHFIAAFDAGDKVDGGAGSDFVGWGGKDYTGASALVLSATSLNSVEEIQCNASHAYSLTMNDANAAAGATLLVDSTRTHLPGARC
jgi:Ca2+-binding RTX toxin-like protein